MLFQYFFSVKRRRLRCGHFHIFLICRGAKSKLYDTHFFLFFGVFYIAECIELGIALWFILLLCKNYYLIKKEVNPMLPYANNL